jgi:hypothetical protein
MITDILRQVNLAAKKRWCVNGSANANRTTAFWLRAIVSTSAVVDFSAQQPRKLSIRNPTGLGSSRKERRPGVSGGQADAKNGTGSPLGRSEGDGNPNVHVRILGTRIRFDSYRIFCGTASYWTRSSSHGPVRSSLFFGGSGILNANLSARILNWRTHASQLPSSSLALLFISG